MEIEVKIDGINKTFRQETINFKTMMMALEFQQRFEAQTAALTHTIGTAIDDEVPEVDYSDLFKPGEDLVECGKLIVAFFDGQFTWDEFIKGCYFKSTADLFEMARKIFEVAFYQKEQSEQKKPLPKKSIS